VRLRTQLDRLEMLAPTRHEIWTQDDDVPGVYHHKELTLDGDALSRRADTSPGSQVIRIVWETVT